MKKFLAVFICVVLVMLFSACGDTLTSNPDNNSKGNESESTSNPKSKEELVYDSTEAFNYLEVEGGIIITHFKNYDYVEYDKIIVPSEIDGKTVVGIGSLDKIDYKVFGYFPCPCEVVIPDTALYIGGRAFMGAKGLVKISGGENCKTIGDSAFLGCEDLVEITFIDSVTDIAENAFSFCTAWEANH